MSYKVESYPYTFVMRQTGDSVPCLLYHFKSTRTHRTYIVRVECYPHHFYGIKFHLKSDSDSPLKYNRMTGLNEPRPLINTCVAIMLEVAQKDPFASFGFIGANMEGEEICSTKRFRVYSRTVSTFVSEEQFLHYEIKEQSAYLLVRRSEVDKNPKLIENISAYFSDNYSNFD